MPESRSLAHSARWTLIPSPVGMLTLGAKGNAITCLWFPPASDRAASDRDRPNHVPPGELVDADALLMEAAAQLAEYFRGERTGFSLPLDPPGTDFEQRVWRRLLDIAYGQTTSYGEIADSLGEPGAAQAVGRAVGANPIGILIPCHRVIGADGSMTGFAGGFACKTYLLDLEGYTSGVTLLPPHL